MAGAKSMAGTEESMAGTEESQFMELGVDGGEADGFSSLSLFRLPDGEGAEAFAPVTLTVTEGEPVVIEGVQSVRAGVALKPLSDNLNPTGNG